MEAWIKCSDELPLVDQEVETKLDDEKGVRNVQTLKLYRGLWWFPDLSMYVYYSPTHWRPIQPKEFAI